MEVHRYITVAPLMLPHKCKMDVELEGYEIKRSSTVCMYHQIQVLEKNDVIYVLQ